MTCTIDDVAVADFVGTLVAHLDTRYPALDAPTFEWLLRALQGEYACRFVVRQFRAQGSLSGACMLMDDGITHVLYVSASAPPLKQKWILGHEIGHIICGHFQQGRRLFALRSGAPLTREEAEAEAVAAELMKRLLWPGPAVWHGAGDAPENVQTSAAAQHHERVAQLFTRLGY
jgi:hypothetical protein